jgi:hypothetical protein
MRSAHNTHALRFTGATAATLDPRRPLSRLIARLRRSLRQSAWHLNKNIAPTLVTSPTCAR